MDQTATALSLVISQKEGCTITKIFRKIANDSHFKILFSKHSGRIILPSVNSSRAINAFSFARSIDYNTSVAIFQSIFKTLFPL